jgi:hypothetical protein
VIVITELSINMGCSARFGKLGVVWDGFLPIGIVIGASKWRLGITALPAIKPGSIQKTKAGL